MIRQNREEGYEETDICHGQSGGPACDRGGPLVKTAQQYPCTITLSHGDKIVDAKKMLSVLRLGAKYGDRITATFDGAYEQEAAEAFAAIVTPAE